MVVSKSDDCNIENLNSPITYRNLISAAANCVNCKVGKGNINLDNRSVKFALIKETVHFNDDNIKEINIWELKGYLKALKIGKDNFNNSPVEFQKTVFIGAGLFIWNILQDSYANPKYKNEFNQMANQYISKFAKLGVTFDFSENLEKLKQTQKFYNKI